MSYRTAFAVGRRTLVGLAIALAGSTAFAQAAAQPRVLKWGIGYPEDHPQGMAVKRFAEVVRERTRGRIAIELHAGGKLGNDVTMTDALREGKLDLAGPDTATLVRLAKPFGVINFPFLLASEQDADLLLDSPFGKELLGTLPPHNIVGLGFWENGFRNLTNNRAPVSRRVDFSQLQVRVMPNAMFQDTFATLGAVPTQLPFPEVYEALRTGKVEAQENPLITIHTSKFYEVQKHLTLSRHAYSALAVLVSKPVWDSLSPADKRIFEEANAEATRYQRELSRERSKQMVEELRKKGMQVTEIARDELPMIRMATRKVIDRHGKEFGEDWVKRLYMQLAVNEHRKLGLAAK
jgi:tripartite ATP-independent transporter DctP family solute receptor